MEVDGTDVQQNTSKASLDTDFFAKYLTGQKVSYIRFLFVCCSDAYEFAKILHLATINNHISIQSIN